MTSDNEDLAPRMPGEEPGVDGLRGGVRGAPSALGPEADPDQGADMSDTGGSQWDSVIRAGGIENEPGLEGLQLE